MTNLTDRHGNPIPLIEEEPDLTLADRPPPDGRTWEGVAAIAADVTEHGPTRAGRLHGLSASGAAKLAKRWRRHPVVLAAVKVRRAAVRERIRAAVEPRLRQLDSMLAKLEGR